MPHGTPDWGHVGPKSTTYGLDDMGELAVRLGSPVTYDRRGDVIWMSAFDVGIGDVFPREGVAGDDISLYVGYARQGPYCVRLTNNNISGSRCSVTKYIPYPVAAGIGFEYSFSLSADVLYLRNAIAGNDGVRNHYGWVRYNHVDKTMEYLDENNAWQTFATGLMLEVSVIIVHTMKLVINFDEQKYVRCLLDDQEYDLSEYSYRVVGGVETQFLAGEVRLWAVANDTESLDVDVFILTQNEPV